MLIIDTMGVVVKKMFWLLSGLCITACGTTPVTEEAPEPFKPVLNSMSAEAGCQDGPVEQFGRYVGDWNIEDSQLSQEDGTTWTKQQGARWSFRCVGNGAGVQDFWYPNTGGFGTNLRIYDPANESWDVLWASSGAPGPTRIRAVEDQAGNIVMSYVSPAQNPQRRITFFPPDANGWNWVMEISSDGGQNWLAVYKIRATRM